MCLHITEILVPLPIRLTHSFFHHVPHFAPALDITPLLSTLITLSCVSSHREVIFRIQMALRGHQYSPVCVYFAEFLGGEKVFEFDFEAGNSLSVRWHEGETFVIISD